MQKIKSIHLKWFSPTLCYILLFTQTTIFYYKNINANTGSITINSAKDVNILASQNITNNHSSYNKTNMMYSIHDNHDLQIATTVSPLLSSNNITISADNNINLLSSILVGQGNLNLTSTNGNVNMQSLQDLYYQYDFSQATSVDLGALIGVIVATIAIAVAAAAVTVFTLGAAGPAAIAGMAAAETGMIGALSAASVAGAAAGMTAITTATLTTAAVVASVGVGLQLGITAAIDHQNGGAAATKDMQSGYMDSTTKQYQKTVGSSLLFGGNVDINNSGNSVGNGSNSNVDTATSISSSNVNQTAKTNESASFKEEHKTIGPDWNQLMTDAAINGVVSGVTVAAGPLIEAGLSKLGSFVSKSFGFTDEATEFATHGLTKSQFDDLALRQGINKSNNVGLRLGNGMGDDVKSMVAADIRYRPLNGPPGKVGNHYEIFYDDGSHVGFYSDKSWFGEYGNIRPDIAENLSQYKPLNNIHYSDEAMRKGVTVTALKNSTEGIKYNLCSYNCQNFSLEAANHASYIDFKENNLNLYNLFTKK